MNIPDKLKSFSLLLWVWTPALSFLQILGISLSEQKRMAFLEIGKHNGKWYIHFLWRFYVRQS